MQLDTPIQYLRGVGPKMALKLKRLGIQTTEDLLFYFPRTWLDLSKPDSISYARIGDQVVINGKIISISQERSFKKRMAITRAEILGSDGEVITAVWFNQPFLINVLKKNDQWNFYGKVEFDWQSREKTLLSPIYEKNSGILPIYHETEGITSKYLRRLIKEILDSPLSLTEFLPNWILMQENLIKINRAIQSIHFPSENHILSRAKTRLAFNELFLIALKVLDIKKELQFQGAPIIKPRTDILVKFTKSLPYKLTNAQRKASWEIIQDMTKQYPMNRLLEGDVGSGKTIVAVIAALNTTKNGFKVVWMAPTEILARQHYETTCKLLKDFKVNISLVTSNKVASNQIRVKSKSLKLKKIQLKSLTQTSELIIGTHALIQEGIQFDNLGLVIIDEQHRFGVKQRSALQRGSTQIKKTQIIADNIRENPRLNGNQRESATKSVPHFLSMTATPIPRTLALSFYGDLDISILDEMPLGRLPIITKLVDSTKRQEAYDFIRQQILQGRQAFVICPLIEEKIKNQTSNTKKTQNLFDIEKKTVIKEFEKLSKQIFPDLKIGLLHGKMSAKEKEETMQDFSVGKINVLVSTSVIEVGVDIANATIMMIEDAEHFGLAQLHQFRGRVGRSEHQSYCLLFSHSLSEESKKRLKIMEECADGFKLAEKDLEIRGPGELVGINQSGLPDLKMASLTDIILVKKVRSIAEKIIDQGLEKYPELLKKLAENKVEKHLE